MKLGKKAEVEETDARACPNQCTTEAAPSTVWIEIVVVDVLRKLAEVGFPQEVHLREALEKIYGA